MLARLTVISLKVPHNTHPGPGTYGQRKYRQGQKDAVHNNELGSLVLWIDEVGCLPRRGVHGRDYLDVGHFGCCMGVHSVLYTMARGIVVKSETKQQ